MRPQFILPFAKNKSPLLCQVINCKNKLDTKNRNRVTCSSCRNRRWRLLHPLKAKYNNLKHHANQRQIPFKLTWLEFLDFCTESGYGTHGGRDLDSDNVDRIKSNIGYVRSNLCLKSLDENSRKGYHERRMLEKYREATGNAEPLNDNEPF